MKPHKLLLYLIVLLCLASSCRNEKVKVGFLLPNLSDDRYIKDKNFFIEKITQLGGEVLVADARNDANLQIEQAKEMINRGVKVLVVCAVNQNLAAAIVRNAEKKGVKVVAHERLIQNCNLDYFICFDHFVVGKQQAVYAVKAKPAGNYVIMCGDKADKNAELIFNGQKQILEPLIQAGAIKIVYQGFVENWSAETAYIDLDQVLKLSMTKIDVVLSANDGMAGGIIKALNENQPGYPAVVTGLDADILACKRIVEGSQAMTVYKPFKTQAEIAAEIAMKLATNIKILEAEQTTNNGLVDVPTISLPSMPVDSINMRSTIIEDKFYTEQEIYASTKKAK
jgi:D-xylose transport system substrate-binding protein